MDDGDTVIKLAVRRLTIATMLIPLGYTLKHGNLYGPKGNLIEAGVGHE